MVVQERAVENAEAAEASTFQILAGPSDLYMYAYKTETVTPNVTPSCSRQPSVTIDMKGMSYCSDCHWGG